MKHEEFLKQVKAAAEVALEPQPVCHIEDVWASYWNATEPQKMLKLLAIIEKLKEQQKHLAKIVADPIGGNWGGLLQELYKELDEIVGQP